MSTPKKNGSLTKHVFPAILVLAALLMIAAIATPNLLRSRTAANESAAIGRARQALSAAENQVPPDRKVVTTAALAITTQDPEDFMQKVVAFAAENGGFVAKLEWLQRLETAPSGTIALRIPFEKLEAFRSSVRQQAKEVRMEMIERKDVTAEYSDAVASIRNMEAEEAQYRSIMARVTETPGVIEIARELAAVRGRIDKMRGDSLNTLRQVEMVAVSIQVERVQLPASRTITWKPVQTIKNEGVEVLNGFSAYADSIIAVALRLPLWGLWILTLVTFWLALWRLTVWFWKRFARKIVVPAIDATPMQT